MDWQARVRDIQQLGMGEPRRPVIWERFERQKVNHRLARYQLQQLRQKNEELIDDFLTHCRNQATKCRFRDKAESDERLIEQLIVGSKHKKVQERLLKKGEELTLDEAIDIARMYEATVSQMEQLEGESMIFMDPYV